MAVDHDRAFANTHRRAALCRCFDVEQCAALFERVCESRRVTLDFSSYHILFDDTCAQRIILRNDTCPEMAGMHEWSAVLAVIFNSKIEDGWQPGKKAGYHAYSAWFLLGEIVRRLDGRPFDRYVREAIFLPLGMRDCHVRPPKFQTPPLSTLTSFFSRYTDWHAC